MTSEPLSGALAHLSREVAVARLRGRLALSHVVPRLPPPLLKRLQARQLRALIHHCQRRVPYYRDLFKRAGVREDEISGPGDLHLLPVTRRRDVQDLSEGALTSGKPRGRVAVLRSSGTSGRPHTMRLDRADVLRRRLSYLRMQGLLGRRPGDLLVAVTPRQSALSPRDQLQLLGNRLREVYLPMDEDPDLLLAKLRGLDPDLLLGYASTLAAMARRALQDGGGPRPRVVFSTGEHLAPGAIREIEAAMGARVLEYYSASECGIIAWPCPAGEGLHIDADNLLLELVDSDGRPALPGEPGQALVTSLINRYQPVVRYPLGDVCVPLSGPCPCGVTFPRLSLVCGRVEDHLLRADGSEVSPYAVMGAMDQVPDLRRYRVEQGQDGAVLVTLMELKGPKAHVALAASAALERLLGAGIPVRAVAGPSDGGQQGKGRVVRRAAAPGRGQ